MESPSDSLIISPNDSDESVVVEVDAQLQMETNAEDTELNEEKKEENIESAPIVDVINYDGTQNI